MRHNMARRKLGRTTSHRTAMLRNMATSLFRHEKITTTVQKAKELRPFAEKLITLAKKENLQARRRVLRHIQDKEIVAKLFDTIGVRFATRPGGYTRIIRTSFRRGDNAEMAIIELVSSDMGGTVAKKAPAKRRAAKKPAAEAKPASKQEAAVEEAVEETKEIKEKVAEKEGDPAPPEVQAEAEEAQKADAEDASAPVDSKSKSEAEVKSESEEDKM